MRIGTLYCTCLLIVGATIASGQTQTGALSATDREVVRAALTHVIDSQREARDGSVLLLDSTSPLCTEPSEDRHCVQSYHLDPLNSAKAFLPQVDWIDYAALRTAFISRNIRSWPLGIENAPLTVVPESEVRKIPRGQLHTAYPNVRYFIGISAPVYSSDRAQALVYVQGYYSFDCGWGRLFVLEHKTDVWVVTPFDVQWIA